MHLICGHTLRIATVNRAAKHENHYIVCVCVEQILNFEISYIKFPTYATALQGPWHYLCIYMLISNQFVP